MPKKKPRRETPAKKVARISRSGNLSNQIRNYMKEHPDEGPAAVRDGLAKKGVTVKSILVSTVKRREREKQAMLIAESPIVKKALPSDEVAQCLNETVRNINATTLLHAKAVVKEFGGLERLREILSVLERLA